MVSNIKNGEIMLSVERLRRIRDFLLEYKHVDVITLSTMLSVSEPTIRKDLEKLESEGIIQRVHGGATLIEDDSSFSVNGESDDVYLLEKQSIAETAEKLIQDGEVIFLGQGSICTFIAKSIKNKKNITLITNNIHILYEIGFVPNINLIMTGGKVEKSGNDLYMSGSLSEGILENVLINKAFFTVDGISDKYGYTLKDVDQKTFYMRVVNISNLNIVVAEYAKFDKTSLIQFLPLDSINTIITNENIQAEYKKILFEKGIQLFTSSISNI